MFASKINERHPSPYAPTQRRKPLVEGLSWADTWRVIVLSTPRRDSLQDGNEGFPCQTKRTLLVAIPSWMGLEPDF